MDALIKTAKGTRDYAGKEKIAIDRIISETEDIYKRRGGVPFDTPAFEIKSILMNKYGEDSKLIYDLADQGGEICALRYDLTVPFARYLAMTKTVKMKRYHTAKVFRRDQPALNRGRYREFYQSDFDIVGEYSHMVADAEIVATAHSILQNFLEDVKKTKFFIRINHKRLVDSLMEVAGIDKSIAGSVGSSIDKLDKISWNEVAKEIRQKGGSEEAVEIIKECIEIKGSLRSIEQLKNSEIGQTESGKEAVRDLERLYELLVVYGVDESVILDVSLIRGLDYYTGILLEGGYEGFDSTLVAGGRYDGLANSLFSTKGSAEKSVKDLSIKKAEIKSVGLSVGVNRLFGLLQTEERSTYTEVLICSVGSNLLLERIRMAEYLRQNGINCEYFMGDSNNFTRHSEYGDSIGAQVLVLIGRKELEEDKYQIITGDKRNREKKTAHLSDLVEEIKKIIEKKDRKIETEQNTEEEIYKAQI